MKIFEMIFDETQEGIGTSAWSFVATPATEIEAVFLSANKEDVRLALNDEKQMFYAIGLVPNQIIDRVNKQTNERYSIVFGQETIKLMAHHWMKNADPSAMNVEHSGNPITGASAVESWLVSNPDNDKSKDLGLTAPVGSWVLGFSIPDKNNWESLKMSGIKGISMEASMLRKEIQSIEEIEFNKHETELEKLTRLIVDYSN